MQYTKCRLYESWYRTYSKTSIIMFAKGILIDGTRRKSAHKVAVGSMKPFIYIFVDLVSEEGYYIRSSPRPKYTTLAKFRDV